jgi:hypothetical protein
MKIIWIGNRIHSVEMKCYVVKSVLACTGRRTIIYYCIYDTEHKLKLRRKSRQNNLNLFPYCQRGGQNIDRFCKLYKVLTEAQNSVPRKSVPQQIYPREIAYELTTVECEAYTMHYRKAMQSWEKQIIKEEGMYGGFDIDI